MSKIGTYSWEGEKMCLALDSDLAIQAFNKTVALAKMRSHNGLTQSLSYKNVLRMDIQFLKPTYKFIDHNSIMRIVVPSLFGTQFDIILSIPETQTIHHFTLFQSVFDNQFYMTRHTWISSSPRSNSLFLEEESPKEYNYSLKHIDFSSASFLSSNWNETNTLRVVTYNLWNFNAPYFERLELMINILRELNADIIGLQEVKYSNFDYPTRPQGPVQSTVFGMPFHYKHTPFHSGHQLWDIVTKLHEYQFYWVAAHHELRDTRISSIPFIQHSAEGLAILSKLPIIDTDVVLLTRNFTGRFSDLHQRIGLSVEVLHYQGPLRFFVTHFSLDHRSRIRNVIELYTAMLSHTRPFILVGDFNDVSDSIPIQFLTGQLELGGLRGEVIDSWRYCQQNHSLCTCNDQLMSWTFSTLNRSDQRRIDYIFNSKELNITNSFIFSKNCYLLHYNKKTVCASDHAPVVTDFLYIHR